MTLWRKPVKGDLIRHKKDGYIINVGFEFVLKDRWTEFEFVSVTPIEPPPEPLRRTVYIPVFKTWDGQGNRRVSPGQAVFDTLAGSYATTGEIAKQRTLGFEHRVGIIKVELVEGQYDE